MIKKYQDFLFKYFEKNTHYNSLGEWVESLYNDEYIKNIISRYTKDIDMSVELSNAINILDDKTKNEIKIQILDYLENGIQEKEPEVMASVDIEKISESEITISGKGVFSSFLKTVTALGKKECLPDYDNCPDEFIVYFYFPNLNAVSVKEIFNRFKSLQRYVEMIDYQQNETSLYFGIKGDGNLEYGIFYTEHTPIGLFRLTNSVINWICKLDSKSAYNLKKMLVNSSYNDIITFGLIKKEMNSFQPGYYEKKSKPKINDNVISFGYYGVGKWDNGKLDQNEFLNIKNNLNTWLLSKKWSQKILINVKANSFWLFISMKLKSF
jgi:hypothetical protein